MRGNDIALEGRIYPRGRDEDHIDLAYSKGGTAYSSFTISCWSHKDKQTDENAYISYRCVAFNELAENIAESFEPGDTVIALGRLQSNNYERDDGEMVYQDQVLLDSLGASVRWAPVTPTRIEQGGGSKSKGKAKPKARDDYGADEAPF